MSAALGWIAALFQNLWRAALTFVSTVLQFLVDVLQLVLGFLMEVFGGLVLLACFVLPDVPNLPLPNGTLPVFVSWADYFVPVSEGLALLAVWATVYAAIWAYKFGKFLRGGG